MRGLRWQPIRRDAQRGDGDHRHRAGIGDLAGAEFTEVRLHPVESNAPERPAQKLGALAAVHILEQPIKIAGGRLLETFEAEKRVDLIVGHAGGRRSGYERNSDRKFCN